MSYIATTLPSKQDFSAVLDSTFRVRPQDGTDFDLALVKFDDLISNAVQENFTLLFRAPADTSPLQGIYRLEHASLGDMDLFLVPVKKDEDGLYFEAVFNRFIEPQTV